MLVLSRKIDQVVRIGQDVYVRVCRVRGGVVQLGIDAPATCRSRERRSSRRRSARWPVKFSFPRPRHRADWGVTAKFSDRKMEGRKMATTIAGRTSYVGLDWKDGRGTRMDARSMPVH